MSNKKFFLFFFFLLFMSFVCAAPYQTNAIPKQIIPLDGEISLFMNNYFTGYDYVSVNQSSGASVGTMVGSIEACLIAGWEMCVTPTSNNMEFSFNAHHYNFTDNILVMVANTTTNETLTYSFIITTDNFTSSDIISSYSAPDGRSFLTIFVAIFASLFPDHNTLITSHRYGYVFMTLFIIDFLILLLAFSKLKGFSKMVFASIGVVDILLVLFFIAIQYIPVVFVVYAFFIMSGVAYLKFKGGG